MAAGSLPRICTWLMEITSHAAFPAQDPNLYGMADGKTALVLLFKVCSCKKMPPRLCYLLWLSGFSGILGWSVWTWGEKSYLGSLEML